MKVGDLVKLKRLSPSHPKEITYGIIVKEHICDGKEHFGSHGKFYDIFWLKHLNTMQKVIHERYLILFSRG